MQTYTSERLKSITASSSLMSSSSESLEIIDSNMSEKCSFSDIAAS